MHHLLPPSRSLSTGTSRSSSSSSQQQFHFRPSNKCLLMVAAVSFLLFVVAEMFGALRSNSLSLLGDAIAMSVDVFSYITNLVAENTKDYNGRIGISRSEYQRIVTEIAIPSFSVLCLLGVTGYIAYDAINVLRHPPLVDDVPLVYLYGFAFLNLVIDVLCATLFVFRGRDVFEEPKMIMPAHVPTISLETSVDSEEDFGHLDEDLDDLAPPPNRRYKPDARYGPYSNSSGSSDNGHHREDESDTTSGIMKKNLNMMSAFTHVGGDTIRTVSVLTAATVSLLSGIDGDVCDAWAAIAVSLTILAMTMPLMIDIYTVACSYSNDPDSRGGGIGYSPIKTKEPIL